MNSGLSLSCWQSPAPSPTESHISAVPLRNEWHKFSARHHIRRLSAGQPTANVKIGREARTRAHWQTMVVMSWNVVWAYTSWRRTSAPCCCASLPGRRYRTRRRAMHRQSDCESPGIEFRDWPAESRSSCHRGHKRHQRGMIAILELHVEMSRRILDPNPRCVQIPLLGVHDVTESGHHRRILLASRIRVLEGSPLAANTSNGTRQMTTVCMHCLNPFLLSLHSCLARIPNARCSL